MSHISEALRKFVKPIAHSENSAKSAVSRREEEEAFERFDSRKCAKKQDTPNDPTEKEQQKPALRLITGGKDEPLPGPEPPEQKPPPTSTEGVTQSFVALMNLIHKNRESILNWLAVRTYQDALLNQKKTGTFRKGAVVDEHIE